MRILSPRASFWTAALIAALALWTSAAPTVVYPLYAAEWHLTPATTTAIFAVYPLALVPVLVIFGNLSDYIGRRATMLTGIAGLAVGSLILALAPDLGWVFLGRALMGVGVGLSLSPATAAMIEFGGAQGTVRASSTTTAATATGLTLSTLVGGFLVQYAPLPAHLTFWVLLGISVLAFGLSWFLPRHTADEARGRWRPRAPLVPRGIRSSFVAGTLGVAGAYALGAVFLALGAQIARQLVDSDNAFVNGAVISISAVVIGTTAVLARRVAPRLALTIGTGAALVGLSLLIVSGVTHSLPLFIVTSVISGVGYSLLFSGGLGLITGAAPEHHRGAVLSAAYLMAYLVQAAAALGLGAVATAAGLQTALEVGAPVIVALGIAALLVAQISTRRPPVVATA